LLLPFCIPARASAHVEAVLSASGRSASQGAELVLEATNMSSPFPVRVSVLLILVLGAAACGDAIAPALVRNQPQPTVLLRAGTATDLELCVADVLERIAPALEQSKELDDVIASLNSVVTALQSRQTQLLDKSSRTYKQAIDKYFGAQEGRAFDPDAVVLRLLSEDLEAVSLFPPLDTIRNN
jgi:hypothetical protein